MQLNFIFCKKYWKECKQAIAEDRINRIQRSKEIFGIPLILYMILALNVSIEKSSSVVDVYDQIFSLNNGGIYDRCYDTEHRINEPTIKKFIHLITQKISFWIFENNDEKAVIYQKNFKEICDRAKREATDSIKNIESDVLIGSYFKVKHCEGISADEVNFVHRSIYEYFIAQYFFESLINLQSKEEAAGKLGELLKRGRLSEQMLQFIKHKFSGQTKYALSSQIKDIFDIMLRDGMTYHTDITARDGSTYHTDAQYKNMLDREMNIFTNMLEMVHLWDPSMGEPDANIISFLRHNDLPGLNLRGITLSMSALRETDTEEADYPYEDFNGTNLSGANLKEANFCHAILSGVLFRRNKLEMGGFGESKPKRSGFTESLLR